MIESAFWRKVRHLFNGLHAVRVENSVCAGTPDVNCTLGWIELKYVPEPPKRTATPLRLPHFTPQQRIWLLHRERAHQRTWLLLGVQKTTYLLAGAWAAEHLGRVSLETIAQECIASWNPLPTAEEFQSVLYESAGRL